MNPYNCISMEYRVGMIEVVLHAETIANIQKEKGVFTATSAFRKGSLLGKLIATNFDSSSPLVVPICSGYQSRVHKALL